MAYIRVSTSEQEIGPEAQRYAIERWCTKHGIELACDPLVDRGVSGGLDFEKRPALVDAIDALKAYDAAILVAHKRDRIARDREVIGNLGLMLRKMGRRICTTEQPPGDADAIDPMAKAMEGVQDIFAEMERSLIRARTKAALQVKKRRDERVGTVPYGWRLATDGTTLIVDKREQKLIRLAHSLRDQGFSLRGIAAELTRMQHKPKRGKAWHTSSVRGLLRQEPQ